MLRKTIKYKDLFTEEEKTEVAFFHLSQAELIELEMSKEGGFVDTMNRIIAAGDNHAIIKEMKNIILLSYGRQSPDGKKFIKNKEQRDEFEQSEAYSALFMELATNTDSAIEFFQGIIPSDLQKQAKALQSPNGEVAVKTEEGPRKISRREMAEMNLEELQAGLSSGKLEIAE